LVKLLNNLTQRAFKGRPSQERKDPTVSAKGYNADTESENAHGLAYGKDAGYLRRQEAAAECHREGKEGECLSRPRQHPAILYHLPAPLLQIQRDLPAITPRNPKLRRDKLHPIPNPGQVNVNPNQPGPEHEHVPGIRLVQDAEQLEHACMGIPVLSGLRFV